VRTGYGVNTVTSQRQHGFFVPGLEYGPWLDPRRFRHTTSAEAAFSAIREEATAILDGSLRCPPHGHGIEADSGAEVLAGNPAGWTEWLLYKDFQSRPQRRAPFPAASRLAAEILATNDYVAYINFQIMHPGTRIEPHVDRHNCLATWWLPIAVPASRCGIEVGGESRALVPGRAVAFDNSYIHRAWNEGDSPRIVLVAYVVHPELAPVERQALGFLIRMIPDINAAFDRAPSSR
jgi:aspartate beta-hydroxylase